MNVKQHHLLPLQLCVAGAPLFLHIVCRQWRASALNFGPLLSAPCVQLRMPVWLMLPRLPCLPYPIATLLYLSCADAATCPAPSPVFVFLFFR